MGRTPCCKNDGKKGSWSPEDDAKLKDFIHSNNAQVENWVTLPDKAGLNRCGKSCRLRWMNYLRPGIRHGNFTEDEEKTIIDLQEKLGNKWSLIAEHLPGRTDNDIKNFWNTRLKKKVAGKGLNSQSGHQQQQRAYMRRTAEVPMFQSGLNSALGHQQQDVHNRNTAAVPMFQPGLNSALGHQQRHVYNRNTAAAPMLQHGPLSQHDMIRKTHMSGYFPPINHQQTAQYVEQCQQGNDAIQPNVISRASLPQGQHFKDQWQQPNENRHRTIQRDFRIPQVIPGLSNASTSTPVLDQSAQSDRMIPSMIPELSNTTKSTLALNHGHFPTSHFNNWSTDRGAFGGQRDLSPYGENFWNCNSGNAIQPNVISRASLPQGQHFKDQWQQPNENRNRTLQRDFRIPQVIPGLSNASTSTPVLDQSAQSDRMIPSMIPELSNTTKSTLALNHGHFPTSHFNNWSTDRAFGGQRDVSPYGENFWNCNSGNAIQPNVISRASLPQGQHFKDQWQQPNENRHRTLEGHFRIPQVISGLSNASTSTPVLDQSAQSDRMIPSMIPELSNTTKSTLALNHGHFPTSHFNNWSSDRAFGGQRDVSPYGENFWNCNSGNLSPLVDDQELQITSGSSGGQLHQSLSGDDFGIGNSCSNPLVSEDAQRDQFSSGSCEGQPDDKFFEDVFSSELWRSISSAGYS